MPRKLPRDYKEEYREYHGTRKQLDDHAARNRAQRKLKREGRGDGKEIDHIDGNPRNNARSNLRVVPRIVNRRKK